MRNPNPDLVEFFCRLRASRRAHPVLPRGARRLVHLEAQVGTYVYLRAADLAHATQGDVVAAFNLDSRPHTLLVPLPGLAGATDRLHAQSVRAYPDRLESDLAPISGAIVA